MQNILDRIVKYSIYVLVFLMPLFWLPFTFEAFEFNKQYLLFFLVSLAFIAWLIKQVVYDKEIRFKRSILDSFVLGFLGIAVLSAIFSADKSSSLYGFYGRFNGGLIGLLSFGALYFLITNNVGKEKIEVSRLLKLFLWSAAAAVLVGYFSVFGLWGKISGFLPFPKLMLQKTFNLTAGSLEGLSVFLVMVIALLAGKFLVTDEKKIVKILLLLASLGLMVVIDFNMAWLILLASLLLTVGFSIWKRLFRKNVNRLLVPIVLIIISTLFIFYSSSLLNLPKEQVLSQGISWQVGFKAAIDNVKNGFLGSGPATFFFDFAEHKPLAINQSWFWQIRFDTAGSYIAELLGTLGFVGIISYLALIGMFLLVSWFVMGNVKGALKDDKEGEERNYLLPILMVFLSLLAGQFFYYQNTVLAFAFWLFLGLAVVSWQKPTEEKVITFKNFPELSLVFSTLMIVVSVAFLAIYFYGVKYYLADIKYVKVLSLSGENRVAGMEGAVKLNPGLSYYRQVLSRIYLSSVLTETAKAQEQRDLQKIQLRTAQAIDQARFGTILQPNSVASWENLGIIYREIKGLAAGALEWGVKSFERAISLEPTNPVLYTELGKLYLSNNQSDKAKENFVKALEKKSDYSDALIQQALILEKEDILDEAISRLESLITTNPFHIDGLFQLGRLYFNKGRIDEAVILFQRVTTLVPGHSNAHYSLGVAFAAQKRLDLAIDEFERVLELNPGNQEVIQKLKQLKGQ